MMDRDEYRILEALDLAITADAITPRIDELVSRAKKKLRRRSDDVLVWEPIPLDLYKSPLPETIRSSWVFVLRANTTTGAERHPNSHQRMMSYRGQGDLQTLAAGAWHSHLLRSDPRLSIEERWVSIPANVWHQGVVADEDWVVVSFYTASEHELIEERPAAGADDMVKQERYSEIDLNDRDSDADV